MEPNRLASFWENLGNAIFDPFWLPFDQISRERKLVWTRNLTQICRMIISSFTRRWNQIGSTVFEKITKNPFLTHFDPPFDPVSREQRMVWTYNLAHICRMMISSFSRRSNQIGSTFFEKITKNPFLTHFDPHLTPYLGNKEWSGPITWHTYVEWWYLPSLGDGTKSVQQFLRKLRKTRFWPILTPIWPRISGTKNGLDL